MCNQQLIDILSARLLLGSHLLLERKLIWNRFLNPLLKIFGYAIPAINIIAGTAIFSRLIKGAVFMVSVIINPNPVPPIIAKG